MLIIKYPQKEKKGSSDQNKNDIKVSAQVSKIKNDVKVNAQVSKDENSMKCKF